MKIEVGGFGLLRSCDKFNEDGRQSIKQQRKIEGLLKVGHVDRMIIKISSCEVFEISPVICFNFSTATV